MLITCDNKGCLQQSEAKLEVENNNVLCGNCGKTINNVTEIMKKTLKSVGQVVRTLEKKAFMLACTKCGINREVVVDEVENTICKVCKSPIKVHAAMKQAIKQFGNKIVEELEVVEEEVRKVVKRKKSKE